MAAFCHPKTVHTEGGRVGGGEIEGAAQEDGES